MFLNLSFIVLYVNMWTQELLINEQKVTVQGSDSV